ncbi:MAG: HD domain-containing protein [Pirellulaceae bacterium]|nr:HD domain-containing protein [Pirellulaceae bacterium]
MLILQDVATHSLLHKFEPAHENETQKHYHNSLSKIRELLQTRDAVIFGLAQLAESRDSDTGQHLERIAIYSNRLANGVRNDPRFSKKASPSLVRLIGISSALHDIGKVAIADSILLKPGPLTESETLSMQYHAEKGAECIEKIEKRLGKWSRREKNNSRPFTEVILFIQLVKSFLTSCICSWNRATSIPNKPRPNPRLVQKSFVRQGDSIC